MSESAVKTETPFAQRVAWQNTFSKFICAYIQKGKIAYRKLVTKSTYQLPKPDKRRVSPC
jgi:hypothetical protein